MPNWREGTHDLEFAVAVSQNSSNSTTLKIERFFKGVWGLSPRTGLLLWLVFTVFVKLDMYTVSKKEGANREEFISDKVS